MSNIKPEPEWNQDQFSALFGFIDGLQANGQEVDAIEIHRGPHGLMVIHVAPQHKDIFISTAGNVRENSIIARLNQPAHTLR